MGKFDGILIATDLDGTLLADDKTVSAENKNAIEYFMSEGGYFTITTGRSRQGIDSIINQIMPNAPIVLFNGSAVYDIKKNEFIWEAFLDENANNVIKLVEEKFPYLGIEVWGRKDIYISRNNELIRKQIEIEGLTENLLHYSDVPDPLRKAMFVQEAESLPYVREEIMASEYADCYNFMQSSECYFELLPKEASKGNGLLKIAEFLGIPQSRTVGIGDNENDISLVCDAGVGVAVANAIPALLDKADFISTDNNSHSISTVIYGIEKKIIEFDD